MEIYKEFLVFPLDYKTKIAFVSTVDSARSWTFEVDRTFPLNEAKPKLFLEIGNEEAAKVQESDKQELTLHNIAVSEAHNLLAFTTSDKSVFLGKIDGTSFTILSRRTYLRTVGVLKFSTCGKLLFLADKTGDTYEYSCVDVDKPARWIFGHISQILDLQIKSDLRFIVTTDRDEKIRVTNYPTTHDIETFCVGHTEFVSSAVFIDNDRLLLSASGDKTLRLWDFTNGKQLQLLNVEFVPNTVLVSRVSKDGEGVLAISSDDNTLNIYRYFIIGATAIQMNLIGQKTFSGHFDFALHEEIFYIRHIHEVDGEKRLLLDKASLTDFSVKFELLYDLSTVLDFALDPSYKIVKPYDTSLLFKKMFNNVELYLTRKRARLDKAQEAKTAK